MVRKREYVHNGIIRHLPQPFSISHQPPPGIRPTHPEHLNQSSFKLGHNTRIRQAAATLTFIKRLTDSTP